MSNFERTLIYQTIAGLRQALEMAASERHAAYKVGWMEGEIRDAIERLKGIVR